MLFRVINGMNKKQLSTALRIDIEYQMINIECQMIKAGRLHYLIIWHSISVLYEGFKMIGKPFFLPFFGHDFCRLLSMLTQMRGGWPRSGRMFVATVCHQESPRAFGYAITCTCLLRTQRHAGGTG
ncbi:hypothetical protein DUE52_31175 [Larkinella punicea]|uniref:Uncharacterized protein n=1 Tax=Larkinella punicea TaxID=2315727 RepID=A0A368JD33_9BACT|nr:hypothetical protein DUE52_31175 [Larkinella punicea]